MHVTLKDGADVKALAQSLGLELCGLADVRAVAAALPPERAPETYLPRVQTVIVVGKGIYRGLTTARHAQMREFMNGRLNRRLEDFAGHLADALEQNGHAAVALPTLQVDHSRSGFHDILPFAQAPGFVRAAAVAAGLGTPGLNGMLLTPEFGPRVFLAAVLTDWALAPDAARADELCPGLAECGRCATVCPAAAIPTRAPADASLAAVRGLDAAACATRSQPVAADAFAGFLADAVAAPPAERARIVGGWRSGELWQQMVMQKSGSLTGCMQCALVCPVGADWPEVERA